MESPRRSRVPFPWRHTAPAQAAGSENPTPQDPTFERTRDGTEQTEPERQRSDQRLLSEGGIPSGASRRLSRTLGDGGSERPFTSDLSPNEAALLRRHGYRPLGLVSGSAVYSIGNFYAPAYVDCEVQVLSDAYNEATDQAVSRMEQEATLLGAHGVVGVRFTLARHQWRQRSIEVQLLGTAIARAGAPVDAPWLSDLSGQDWCALHRAGYEPVGLVYGHCTWFLVTTELDGIRTGRFTPNREVEHWSAALRECRLRANGIVAEMARRCGASGVVGVHISRQVEAFKLGGPRANMGMTASRRVQGPVERPESHYTMRGRIMNAYNPALREEHHNLTLSIIGTAIRVRKDPPRRIRATRTVLSLRDGRVAPDAISTAEARFE